MHAGPSHQGDWIVHGPNFPCFIKEDTCRVVKTNINRMRKKIQNLYRYTFKKTGQLESLNE